MDLRTSEIDNALWEESDCDDGSGSEVENNIFEYSGTDEYEPSNDCDSMMEDEYYEHKRQKKKRKVKKSSGNSASKKVPFSTLHPAGNATVLPPVREWHTKLSHLHLTNPYGLFRRMTGVGGRPEIVILGSNDLKGPWSEYPFLYKPGDVNRSLPFVAPHQPRLDWQMWFAALGTYHQNPWIMSLTYRILTGQPEVLALLDNARNPFPKGPPKYLKADLYHYHYTSWSQRYKSQWWTSEKVGEYFPVFSKDHPPLLEYLRNLKILSVAQHKSTVNPQAKAVLDQLRAAVTQVDGGILLWSLFTAGAAIIMLGGWSTPATTPRSKKN